MFASTPDQLILDFCFQWLIAVSLNFKYAYSLVDQHALIELLTGQKYLSFDIRDFQKNSNRHFSRCVSSVEIRIHESSILGFEYE